MSHSLLDSFIVTLISSRANSLCKNDKSYNLKLKKPFVQELLTNVSNIFDKEPSLLYLPSDIVVVGDLHGNVDDLIRFFSTMGYPPETKYLFLGDYVDRGQNSVEVLLLLFSLKLKYPESVYMIRGNHECESLTTAYGFRNEATAKLDEETYFAFMNTFQYLPYGALVNKEILCLHGGISQSITYVDEIQDLQKSLKIPSTGPIADILWSDPRDKVEDFVPSDRKVGYLYGWKAVNKFMSENKLKLLVRSHEACDNGFKWAFNNIPSAKGKCLTIFSNSDYGSDTNSAAILKIDSDNNYKIIHYQRASCGPIGYPTWVPENKTKEVFFKQLKKKKPSYETYDDDEEEDYEYEEESVNNLESGEIDDEI